MGWRFIRREDGGGQDSTYRDCGPWELKDLKTALEAHCRRLLSAYREAISNPKEEFLLGENEEPNFRQLKKGMQEMVEKL